MEKILKPNWQLFVNKATIIKLSTFHKFKDDIPEDTSALLNATKRLDDKEIQSWRQDNAGNNKALEENMKGEHWSMQTKFKYTVSGTP